jgi:hypothetical protein
LNNISFSVFSRGLSLFLVLGVAGVVSARPAALAENFSLSLVAGQTFTPARLKVLHVRPNFTPLRPDAQAGPADCFRRPAQLSGSFGQTLEPARANLVNLPQQQQKQHL